MNNPTHALGQSISFGRFMTESLAWEKWSSFSHNRYVEEAERYSKPGSVAQKKAFFEAHYKKLAAQKAAAAAALLEQANSAAENKVTREEDEGAIEIESESHSLETSMNCEMVVKEEQDVKVEASVISERNKVEETEPQMEEVAVVGNSMKVELENQFEDIDNTFEERSEKLSGTSPILTPTPTPTMKASKEQNHSSLTPLTEKRNKTPKDSSGSRNHTAGPKWRLLSGENKMRSPIISSPFSLRTEERAARRRKKKLEEKFNSNVAQKVQLHTKLREKAGTEIRKLRQSFCFQARPLPDFYKERKEATKIETRQVPLMHSESPNEGRKFTKSIAESKTSIPPNKPFPSMKNNGTKNFQGKSGRNLNLTTHENTSPNIQHWNQNDRSYK